MFYSLSLSLVSFPLGQAKNLNGSFSKKALALVEALEGKVRSLLFNRLFITFGNILPGTLIKSLTTFFCVLPSKFLFSCGLTMLIYSQSFYSVRTVTEVGDRSDVMN